MMAAPTIMPATSCLQARQPALKNRLRHQSLMSAARGNRSCTPLGRSMGQGRNVADPRALSSPQASSVPRLLPGVMLPLVVATTSWAHLVVYAAMRFR